MCYSLQLGDDGSKFDLHRGAPHEHPTTLQKKPGIASKLCTKFSTVVEVIPPKGEFIQTYLRVKVEVAS